MEKGDAHTGFWWGNLRERVLLGEPDVADRNWGVRIWTGSRWLRIGTVGGHL